MLESQAVNPVNLTMLLLSLSFGEYSRQFLIQQNLSIETYLYNSSDKNADNSLGQSSAFWASLLMLSNLIWVLVTVYYAVG
ncbi:hypothetical protein AMR41_24160 [Hapalosiphon sp. MRB220]|nr:hypothetical protein AMR41_24160 [Hapalosiphon sp. MRB220]